MLCLFVCLYVHQDDRTADASVDTKAFDETTDDEAVVVSSGDHSNQAPLNKEQFSDLESCLTTACERVARDNEYGDDDADSNELSVSGSSNAAVEANLSYNRCNSESADHSHVDNDDYNVMLSSSSTPTAPVADGEAFDTFSSFSLSTLAASQAKDQQHGPARHDHPLHVPHVTSSSEIKGCSLNQTFRHVCVCVF